MASRRYRIEIPIDATDNTGPALERADARVTKFERSMSRTQRRLTQMNATRWQLTVSALDRVSAVVDRINGRLSGLVRAGIRIPIRALDMATAPIRGILRMATSLPGLMMAGIGGYGAYQIGSGFIGSNAFKESSLTGLEVMLKSREAGEAAYQQSKRFADVTPWDTRDVTASTGQLVAGRFDTGTIFQGGLLTDVSDLAAANQDVQATLGQVSNLFGRLKSGDFGESFERLRDFKIGYQDLREAGLRFSKSNEYLGTAEEAIAGVRKVIQSRFGGLTDRMGSSWQGIWSTFTSTADTIFQRIGEGKLSRGGSLFDLLKERVKGLTGLIIDENGNLRDNIQRFADRVAGVFDRLDAFAGSVWTKVQGIWNDPQFQNADVFGKLQFAWDQLIGDPFADWWAKGGDAKVQAWASKVGGSAGGVLGGMMSGLFGLAAPSTLPPGQLSWSQQTMMTGGGPDQLMKPVENPFVTAGRTAGSAFFEAFVAAFDAGKLAEKAKQTMAEKTPDLLDGYKDMLTNGGTDTVLAAWMGATGLGWLWPLIKGPVSTAKNVLVGGGPSVSGRAATAARGATSVAETGGLQALLTAVAATSSPIALGVLAELLWMAPLVGYKLGGGKFEDLSWLSQSNVNDDFLRSPGSDNPQVMTFGDAVIPVQIEGWKGFPKPDVLVAPPSISITVTTQELNREQMDMVLEESARRFSNVLAMEIENSLQNTPSGS
jgi:hypothetical protein